MRARIEESAGDVEIPRPQRNPARPALQRVARVACMIAGVPTESLTRQSRSSARLMIALLGRHFHYSQREIGQTLGIGRAAVSMMEHAAKKRKISNPEFHTQLNQCMEEFE